MQHGNITVPGMKSIVFSRTLRQSDYPDVTIVAEECDKAANALRAKRGKDIWLFGGGSLFRSLLEAGLVDTVEVGVIPVILGGGIPLLPSPATQAKLKLTGHKVYKTGIVSLQLCGEMNLLQRVCAGNAAKAATLRRRAAKPALLFIRVGQPKPCPDENQDARLKPGATRPLH